MEKREEEAIGSFFFVLSPFASFSLLGLPFFFKCALRRPWKETTEAQARAQESERDARRGSSERVERRDSDGGGESSR